MKTTVVHCHKDPYDIYIGRRRDTDQHYGNPFKIDGKATREDSIFSFRMWLTGQDFIKVEPQRRKWILNNMYKLKGKRLGCWCKPEACHGDVYAEMLEG